jgi:N-acetylmuramoyl-L-alanine amidase
MRLLMAWVVACAVARPAVAAPVLDEIEIVEQPAAVRLHLSARVTAQARTLAASGVAPDRIYLDLPATLIAADLPRVTLPTGLSRSGTLILRVRTGQFEAGTARVVLDLAHAVPFSVEERDRTITIALRPSPSDEVAAAAPPARPTPAVSAPPPASPPERTATATEPPPRLPVQPPANATPPATPPAPAPESAPEASQPLPAEPPPPIAPPPPSPSPERTAKATAPPPQRPPEVEAPDHTPAPTAPATPPPDARRPPPAPAAPLGAALPPKAPRRPAHVTSLPEHPLIVIDAGHGGRDPGAAGVDGVVEKDVVLELARVVTRRLTARLPVDVLMTRVDDSFVPIQQRLAAPGLGASLFISLHANACTDPSAHGLEIFYGGGTVRRASSGGTDPRSALLGRCLNDALEARIGGVRGAARPGTFSVLVHNSVPSALVEIGYLTHPGEAARAQDADYQELMADALTDGVAAFLRASAPPL